MKKKRYVLEDKGLFLDAAFIDNVKLTSNLAECNHYFTKESAEQAATRLKEIDGFENLTPKPIEISYKLL